MIIEHKSCVESRPDEHNAIESSPFNKDIWIKMGKSNPSAASTLRSTCRLFANNNEFINEKIKKAINCESLDLFISYYACVDPDPIKFRNVIEQHKKALSLHRSYISVSNVLIQRKDKKAFEFMIQHDPLGQRKNRISDVMIMNYCLPTPTPGGFSSKEWKEYMTLFAKHGYCKFEQEPVQEVVEEQPSFFKAALSFLFQ